MRPAVVIVALAIVVEAGEAVAQPSPEARDESNVSVRIDSVFRGVPRYVLTAADGQASAADRYWRTVTLAPIMARATLDARGLSYGHLEAHLNAWGAVDLAAADPQAYAAGDLAVAWARYAAGPWGVWAGRRFVSWGAPGGVHVDGIGGEVTAGGFNAEVMVGRPVTPAYGAMVGAQPSFDGVTAAFGARVGWMQAGTFAASASYLERWAYGVAGVRALSLDATFTPTERLDLRAAVAFDAAGGGVTQASADVDWTPASWGLVGAGYAHVDPSRLIPKWSILSVFATQVFDEMRASFTWRPSRVVSLRFEGAGQRYDVPGSNDDARWGSRVEAMLRVTSRDRSRQGTVSASRRDDGVRPLTLVRLAGMWTLPRNVGVALEGAAALDDDDPSSSRTSLYARAAVDVPLGRGWRVGAAIDGVRSPIALGEVRALAHGSWTYESRGGAR